MTFAERLKELRKRKGLTQTQLADALGVHLQTVSKWERGVTEPDISLIGETAAALARMHPGAEGVGAAAAACGGVLSVGEALLAGGGEDFRLAQRFLSGKDMAQVCRAAGERGKTFFAALRLVLRDVLLLRTGQEKYAVLPAGQLRPLAERYPAGAAAAAIGLCTDAEREISFNANPAQAALTLALRMEETRKAFEKYAP